MGPPTAAKHAGYDWKTLTPAERKLVSEVTRALNRHHEARNGALLVQRLEVREAFPDEEIAAAAILYHDLGGVVMSLPAPARHHHVMWARHFVDGEPTGGNGTQGFLTTRGRFVGRIEGLKIATKRGQIEKKHPWEGELYTEDMWPETPAKAWGWIIENHGPRPDDIV